jgi:hypothetical protein
MAAADGPGKPATEGMLGEQRADREAGLNRAPERLSGAVLRFDGCLGDVLSVPVDVFSILPRAVPVQQVTLVVAIMQVRDPSVPLSEYFAAACPMAATLKIFPQSILALAQPYIEKVPFHLRLRSQCRRQARPQAW